MRSFYRTLLLALPLVGTVVCDEPASPTKQTKDARPVYASANEAFQDLLNALPEESLHVALNSLTHFQDGVFESDRHGVERVHQDDPPLATKLIVAAVQDLKKRQSPNPTNGTQAASTPTPSQEQSQAPNSQTPSSQTPPESSQESAVVVPVPITKTDSNGQTTVVSSAILSEPTASVAVPVTRTNANGQTEVVQETKPAVIFTATDAAGSATVITSAVEFAPTPGQVMTTTNAHGSTFLTTYTPGGGLVSSIKLITTTGADGRPSVITSYAFVNPVEQTGTDGQPIATGTASGRPGLQSPGAANKKGAMEAVVAGGAVVGAFALWI